MPTEVMAIEAKQEDVSANLQAMEIAQRLTAWLAERPRVRVINVETLLVSKDGALRGPYPQLAMDLQVRVWLDVPDPSETMGQ